MPAVRRRAAGHVLAVGVYVDPARRVVEGMGHGQDLAPLSRLPWPFGRPVFSPYEGMVGGIPPARSWPDWRFEAATVCGHLGFPFALLRWYDALDLAILFQSVSRTCSAVASCSPCWLVRSYVLPWITQNIGLGASIP